MEVYTLDPILQRSQVIDRFESLIWAERFSVYGDFELDIFPTRENVNLLRAGTLLAMSESYRVMIVETVQNSIDNDGRRILTVKGRSIESLLLDRVAKNSLEDLTTSPKWVLTGTPGAVARKIFNDICVLGILDSSDVLPFLLGGTFMPPSTIPEPLDPVTVEVEPTTVYKALADICGIWNLGFRLIRNLNATNIRFDVYSGDDRSSSQSDFPAVIFAPELDNLQNTKELTTIDKAKNVAYVYSAVGFQKVYPDDVDPTVSGFDRRVLVVNATDIKEDNPDIPAALIQRGKEELAKNRAYSAFDGEISQFSSYRYGTDYNLGDLVEMRNTTGSTNVMRVTEQIFVSDRDGERSYPTLTINTFINSGSWLSWMNNKSWIDLGPTEYWEDQP